MTILIRPLINEKSTKLISGGFYTFEVSKQATKQLVAKIVTEKFKVDVLDVNIINIAGKNRMQKARRRAYTTADIKKALVKLKKGQKIAIFEMTNPEPDQEVKVTTAEGEEIAVTKEKKSLLRGTKVKIEKKEAASEKKQNLSSKKKGDK